MFVNKYPYTDMHELNLDWLLCQMLQLRTDMKDFINQNVIKYADPIQWNITTQYEANTVVIEPTSGNAYISSQPVPAGVAISNTDYWSVIGNFSVLYESIKESIAAADDGSNINATEARDEGQLLWLNSKLYKVLSDISVGALYITSGTGQNLQEVTIEELLISQSEDIADINTLIGDIESLVTVDKTSIVNAINSLAREQLYHSPKEYGAIGDGVADDTEAVSACILNHNFVAINDGTYKISDTINLRSNMRIIGNGTIYNPSEFLTSFKLENVSNVIIEGISFSNGERSGNTYLELNANIYVKNCTDIIIDGIKDYYHNKGASIMLNLTQRFIVQNCDIRKSGYAGIECYGNCLFGKIDKNYVEVDDYTGYANTYAIDISCYEEGEGASKSNDSKYIIISNNTVETSLGFWEGIDSHGCDHLLIINNIVRGFCYGIVQTRFNAYDSATPGGATFCAIINNMIEGASEIHSSRSEMCGIRFIGNKTQMNESLIAGNVITNMYALSGGNYIGTGISIEAHAVGIINNSFLRQMGECIKIDYSGIVTVANNCAERSVHDFIVVDNINNTINICNNSAQNIANFYKILTDSNVNFIQRANNQLVSGKWQDNAEYVTDVSKFVPDKVNVDPSSSPYHPEGAIALKAQPAAGSPMGWIANGSTWLKMPNLTS